MKVLLDTNFLVDSAKYRIRLDEQLAGHELLTLDKCIRELEKLAQKRTAYAKSAAVALEMAKRLKIERGRRRTTDAAIVEYAASHGCAVATNDRELIKSLKKNGIKIIRLRQKRLIIEEEK